MIAVRLRLLALTCWLAVIGFMAAPASAQEVTRNWEEGSVWTVTRIDVAPNLFNQYINQLNDGWKRFIDAQMARGDVISYKILYNPFAAANDSDIILLIEYRNMAVFDKGVSYLEEIGRDVFGDLDTMDDRDVALEKLRTIEEVVVTREIIIDD